MVDGDSSVPGSAAGEQRHEDGGGGRPRGLRETLTGSSGKLRLGKGGNKSRRGSATRTSAIHEASHLAQVRSVSSSSSGLSQGELESLSMRLRRLKEAGGISEQQQPFRIKFVNNRNEATMADVYPSEDFKDIIQKVVEKLRMPNLSNYVLLYKDTDDEEIGVACTDNLREMFAIFEPGSKLQLRIVQLNINNSGALDSIPNIWDNGHTPNVFLGEEDGGGHSEGEDSDTSSQSVALSNLKLATAGGVGALPEMEEKPKPAAASPHHLAVEDVAETAVAAAVAATAAAALATAVGDKCENSNASDKAEPPTPTPTSPASPVAHAEAPKHDGDELRQAIAMMSNNLALAIESLGTKLTCNFDRLSNEQAKIIDTLAHAQTTQQQTKVEVKTGSASADEKVTVTTTTVTKDAEDTGDRDEAVEEKVSVSVAEEKARTESTTKVEEKAEAKTESSTKVEEVAETKTETTTTTTEVKSEEKVEVDVVVEEEEKPAKDADAETIEVEVMDAVCEPVSEPASAHEPVLTPEPIIAPKPAPAPEPAPAAAAKPAATEKVTITVQKDSDEHRRAETFKAHLRAANFAFHTNPYASSFFQHGFSEVGMPSYIRNPCMMQSPYTGVTECSCALSSCASCLTTKLSSMGYAVTQMQVSSLLSVYNGDSARVIDYVTR